MRNDYYYNYMTSGEADSFINRWGSHRCYKKELRPGGRWRFRVYYWGVPYARPVQGLDEV